MSSIEFTSHAIQIMNNFKLNKNLPKYDDYGYNYDELEYILESRLNPNKINNNMIGNKLCLPFAESILYQEQYKINLNKKRSNRRAFSLKNSKNKNDFKVYLKNHPKDTIVSKNVLALLLAENIHWN